MRIFHHLRSIFPFITLFLLVGMPVSALTEAVSAEPANGRKPQNELDLKYWLQNMVWYHGFSNAEIQEATGLSLEEIRTARERLGIHPGTRPGRARDAGLLVMPYPGGRHPRIGFLDGAIRPQRETKVSVFLPWSDSDYVVADIPEAIWSNLGLTYLAHTHIDTVWTKQGIDLEKLEWNRRDDGTFDLRRLLPNGIEFTVWIKPRKDHVRMEMELFNGSDQSLTDLRVQNCIMLKGAEEFRQQENTNKLFRQPFVACHSPDRQRWIITAWSHCNRAWANAPCPCLHSDPKFPDCPPGQKRRLVGWLSFYEGADIESELSRIESLNWSAVDESAVLDQP